MSMFGKYLQNQQSSEEVIHDIQMTNIDGIVKGDTERLKSCEEE